MTLLITSKKIIEKRKLDLKCSSLLKQRIDKIDSTRSVQIGKKN